MNIQIKNDCWINIDKHHDDYWTIDAGGTNGNTIEICDIRLRYLKSLYKDIREILIRLDKLPK